MTDDNILARHGVNLLVSITPVANRWAGYVVRVSDVRQSYPVVFHTDSGPFELAVQATPFLSENKIETEAPGLLDARHVVMILPSDTEGRQWFEYEVVPSRRTLSEILTNVVEHGKYYPNHGPGCGCMDNLVRELRAHVNRCVPEFKHEMGHRSEEWDHHMDAQLRIGAVLHQLVRNL